MGGPKSGPKGPNLVLLVTEKLINIVLTSRGENCILKRSLILRIHPRKRMIGIENFNHLLTHFLRINEVYEGA